MWMIDDTGGVPDSLPFLVALDDMPGGDTMAIFPQGARDVALRWVPVAALRTSLRETVGILRELLEEVADDAGRLKLSEAQVGFEVTASGGVQLIGTAQVGAKGAITLIFRN